MTTTGLDVDRFHKAALVYAARGWRVVPIIPGKKSPPLEAWQEMATTDVELINTWWQRWPGHGVGIATGRRSGIFVVDVDVSDGKIGDETLADLEHTHGQLPATVECLTGSDGRHLYYRYPDDLHIGNDAGMRLGPGIDIRGSGGQVLAPPTVHPNGTPYEWEVSGDPDDVPVADAPQWLLDLLTRPPEGEARRERLERSTGGWTVAFAAAVSWPTMLEHDDAVYLGTRRVHTDDTTYEIWARPGIDGDHTSATLYYKGSDVLKVHSSAWGGVDRTTGEVWSLEHLATYTRWGYYTARWFGGDFSASARHLRHLVNGTDGPANPIDEAFLANGGQAPPDEEEVDTLLADGPEAAETPSTPAAALELRWLPATFNAPPVQPVEIVKGFLNAGELCAMAAPRAIGKSWFAMNLAVAVGRGEGLIAGNLPVLRPARVLYAHGELDPHGAYERWFRMCAPDTPPDTIAETFDRWRIRTVKRRTTSTVNGIHMTDDHIDAVVDTRLEQTIAAHGIEVLIIDPWAVYYAGAENSNDETEAALDKLRDLSLRYGLAVVLVHHISAKTQPGHLAEPEDLWRGASRLADWASTRVTILRHFTETEAEDRQLTRQEARRFADVKLLRRGAPTPDFSMRMDFTSGWWQAWTDDSRTSEPKLTPEGVAEACANAGSFESVRYAAAHLDEHHSTVKPLLDRCVVLGLLRTEPGLRGATRYLPPETPK